MFGYRYEILKSQERYINSYTSNFPARFHMVYKNTMSPHATHSTASKYVPYSSFLITIIGIITLFRDAAKEGIKGAKTIVSIWFMGTYLLLSLSIYVFLLCVTMVTKHL